MQRIYLFFKKQLLRDHVFLILFIVDFLKKDFSQHVFFYTEEQLFEKINQGHSLIRLGDGDMGIIHGKDIFHQVYEKELATSLLTIIKDYNPASKYILSIPKFVGETNQSLRIKKNLICWLPFKIEFKRLFSKDAYYADAHIFYFLKHTNTFFNYIKYKNILYVSNQTLIDKVKKSDLHHDGVIYLVIPESGTSLLIENIKSQIDILLKDKKATKIVFSCGCSSRVLSFYYSKQGYQCFDIGTGIGSYLDQKDYSYMI